MPNLQVGWKTRVGWKRVKMLIESFIWHLRVSLMIHSNLWDLNISLVLVFGKAHNGIAVKKRMIKDVF